MKNPGGGMDIALILGAGALAWWYFMKTSLPAGVPATGNANGYMSPNGRGTVSAPVSGDLWLNVANTTAPNSLTAANVVAIYNGTAWVTPASLQAQVLQTTTAQSPAPVSTVTTPTPVTIAPAGSKPSLATIGQNLQNVMSSSGDPAITGSGASLMATPYVFNYYLGQSTVNGGAFSSPPDVGVVFGGSTPGVGGVDITQPMSFNQFWNGMSAYLRANNGLSGLSAGYQSRSPYFSHQMGGWLA